MIVAAMRNPFAPLGSMAYREPEVPCTGEG